MGEIPAAIESAALEAALGRALELARRGPATGPNPQVGCVLLRDSRIVAEGWHEGAGTPHAEVAALADAAAQGIDSRGLTAVVTLEPCNHHGRTGPCSEALIAAGVSAVYYAHADPGAASRGGGARLAAAGIPAILVGGELGRQASELVFHWEEAVTRGRPWVTVKWASTLDGRTAAADGTSRWITGSEARRRVHEQRAAADAILVGTGTVIADDPALTARDGEKLHPHQPVPVVVGLRPVPEDAALRRHPAGLVELRTRELAAVFAELHAREFRRVYVEGGPTLASAVIAGGWADEYAVYLAPALLGGPWLAIGDLGIPSIDRARRLSLRSVERLGDDLLVTARPVVSTSSTTSGEE